MAKLTYEAGDFGKQLDQLASRESLRGILQAGCEKAVDVLKDRTEANRHVVTGGMLEGISAGPIHEDLGRSWAYVYPSGEGDHGQDLAKVAYVINYGIGGDPTRRKTKNKTGDKFLTGKKASLDEAVGAAMKAEAERIKNEIMR